MTFGDGKQRIFRVPVLRSLVTKQLWTVYTGGLGISVEIKLTFFYPYPFVKFLPGRIFGQMLSIRTRESHFHIQLIINYETNSFHGGVHGRSLPLFQLRLWGRK